MLKMLIRGVDIRDDLLVFGHYWKRAIVSFIIGDIDLILSKFELYGLYMNFKDSWNSVFSSVYKSPCYYYFRSYLILCALLLFAVFQSGKMCFGDFYNDIHLLINYYCFKSFEISKIAFTTVGDGNWTDYCR